VGHSASQGLHGARMVVDRLVMNDGALSAVLLVGEGEGCCIRT
jgi:hypothetical protein